MIEPLTKHDILNQIYIDYNIEEMIINNIKETKYDESYKDLSQQIYLILYDLPFSKLYYLYSRKQIPSYITGIIKNHRKSPYLELNKYYRCFEHELKYDIPDVVEEEINTNTELQKKLDVIDEVLYKKYKISNITGFTKEEQSNFFCIEVFKLYIKKKMTGKYSFTKLSKELKINRQLISNSIQEAKRILKDEFNNNNK